MDRSGRGDDRPAPSAARREYVTCRSYTQVAEAIRDMTIRGAPAIGVAAAMGVALGVLAPAKELEFRDGVRNAGRHASHGGQPVLGASTACSACMPACDGAAIEAIAARMMEEARLMREEDIAICRAIGRNGAELVPDGKPC